MKFSRRNSLASIRGEVTRCSTRTKAIAAAIPTTRGTRVCGLSQPLGCPWVRARTNPIIAAANKAEPNQSISRNDPDLGVFGTATRARTRAATANGTLIKNTSRQSTAVSRPPRTGPAAAKHAEAPARTPRANPRRSFGQTAAVIATVAGIRTAAARPWRTRADSIHGRFCAAPASAVATAKIAAAAMKALRRPTVSATRPPTTRNAASGRMLAVRIHGPNSRLAPRSITTSGLASGTAVWSTKIMLLASVMPTSASHILPVARGASAGMN